MQRIEFRRKAVGNARTNAVNKLRIKHSAGNIQPISDGANTSSVFWTRNRTKHFVSHADSIQYWYDKWFDNK